MGEEYVSKSKSKRNLSCDCIYMWGWPIEQEVPWVGWCLQSGGFRTLPFFRLIYCCILESSVQSFLWIDNAQRERILAFYRELMQDVSLNLDPWSNRVCSSGFIYSSVTILHSLSDVYTACLRAFITPYLETTALWFLKCNAFWFEGTNFSSRTILKLLSTCFSATCIYSVFVAPTKDRLSGFD